METIKEKAMLVDLSISVYTARKFDKKVTREVADQHHTTDKAGRYNKNLLPIDAPSYKAVMQASGAARTKHYALTLPWSDEGSRILPSQAYMKYTTALRACHGEFNAAVANFQADYPQLRDNALAVLNGLANLDDYPSEQELAKCFKFRTQFLPFPDAEDFRVTGTAIDTDAIKAQIEADTKTAISGAMNELYRRLFTVVNHMATKLADSDSIFRDSLVNNIVELCELLPSLNLTNDPVLNTIRETIEESLIVSPDVLRNSKVVRNDIRAKAEAIAANLNGYLM